MTLHINEAEVRSVLTMAMALEAVEESLRKQARGEVVVQPRRRFELPKGFYHYMAAADYAGGYVAEKQYTYVAGKIRFLVLLYEMATGDLVAQIEADYMGQLRTGAASGVATKFMARRDARVAAIIGTGGQARTQLEAIAGVRKLELARAYGRDVSRREKFCSDMAERLRIPVHAAGSAAQAIKGADITCTATTASQPVVTGSDIAPGMHINAIGVNHAHKQELDEGVVSHADLIAVDSTEQSRQEAGDLIMAFGQDESKWSSVRVLADIVDGKIPGRSNNAAVTLFKSNGIASWDLAVAMRVLALAREKDLGRKLPLWTSL
ncbi:MAG TPA: ornithine cyclodeaminase family protein [Verrucomicrobiae bacterium]|nr:ornithine cyclodeaminase family protein [Verrucomicrobiae bacterium]